MAQLAVAREEHIDSIYEESHSLWGGGLDGSEYRRFWAELSATPWARRRVTYFAWIDGKGELLSSAKLYRPRLLLLGDECRAAILGAVFTPREQRRQGHAGRMIEAILDQAQRRGDRLALLFSDIGTRYYGEMGFRALPCHEVWGRLHRVPAAEGEWTVEEMRAEHLADVRGAHNAWCRRRSLAFLRSVDHWQFLFVRTAGFFKRLDDPRLRHRATVVFRNGRFMGYLICVEGHGEWSVREVGAVDGDPANVEQVLRVGAAQARGRGLRKFYAWLEDAASDRMTEWAVRRTERRRAQPMLRVLNGELDVDALVARETPFFPYQDQF